MSEMNVDALNKKIDVINSHFAKEFDGVRADLKDLTRALRDLIRLDGKIENLTTLVTRVGIDVDDHEKRMREIETREAASTVRLGSSERFLWLLASILMSTATGLIVKALMVLN